MKLRILTSIILAAALCYAIPAAAGGTDSIKYVTPDDISIEDVFFSRFGEQIYNIDSTLKAQTVEADYGLDEAEWDSKFEKLTLWGATSDNAVDTYNAAVRMFLKNPDVKYADIAERALYNGVLAEIDSTRRGSKLWSSAAQAVLNAPATAYASRGSDLWVNLYFRNRAYVKNDSLDMVILQNTSAPWGASVFFSLKFNNANTRMRLHLRLPAWLRGSVTPAGDYTFVKTREFYQVVVNGVSMPLRAGKDGYITIDRVWQSDDVVRLTLRDVVRRIRPAGESSGRFAVQEGPVVYACETRGEKKFFDPAAAFGNKYDKDVLHTNAIITKEYSEANTSGATPWDSVLLPYYVAYGRNLFKPEIWLPEVEKTEK